MKQKRVSAGARKYTTEESADTSQLNVFYRHVLFDNPRTYTPSKLAADTGSVRAGYSDLAERNLNGMWEWKPDRDRARGENFVELKNLLTPGAAELEAAARHSAGERGWRRCGAAQ